MLRAKPHWRRLLLHIAEWAADLARDNAGNNTAARIAMMAMTTRSSIKVKADGREICGCLPLTRFVRLRRVMLYTACCHFSECLKAMSWPSLFQPPHVWISELVWLLVLAIVGPD